MRRVLIPITAAGLMVTGFVTLILVFADPPPGKEVQQFALAFGLAAVAGFLFGIAIGYPRWGALGAIAGWGGATLGLLSVISGIVVGDFVSEWQALEGFGLLFGPAVVGAAGGMLGSLIGRWIAPPPSRHGGGVSPMPPPVIGTNRPGSSDSSP